jgi:hypothetical protein
MTGRSTFRWRQWRHYRKARWVVLAAALPVIWACNNRQLETPTAMPMRTFNTVFQQSVNRDVDILFMIDNSRSMLPLQQKLLTNFPIFMQTLQQLPMGLPNVHIAVVSSDMGAGLNSVELCNNDGGNFHYQVGSAAPATCTSTGLAANQTYISNVNGVTNYTGTIENVFTCIAALGQDGCGFEAQLESVAHALGADGPAPDTNNGFLRPNAYLAMIFITNEDDCSVPGDSNLFISGPGHQFVADPEGPLVSYRCNEFGHLCNGAPPPRTMAMNFVPASVCVPAEEMGQLIPVHTLVDEIKKLKPDPTKILVAVIAGIPDKYNVILTPPLIAQDPSMWAAIDHSCMQNSGEYADPGVRLAAFVRAFGANGLFLTICADSFAPALQGIAEQIGKVLGPKCVQGQVIQNNGIPDCTVVDVNYVDMSTGGAPAGCTGTPVGSQLKIECPLAACASNGNTAPCWQLANDAMCPNAKVLQVMRPAGNLPSDLNSEVSCSVCIPGSADPRCN